MEENVDPLPLSNYARQLGKRLRQATSIKNGVRFFPLALAAPLAQAPETTIRDWIRKRKKFGGKLIKTSRSLKGLSISEESINRVAHRFIQWPSQAPVGAVTIGETEDGSGYIPFTEAARMIGVERHTIWRWMKNEKAPIDRPVNVIRCPAANQFYISEKDVAELKTRIPQSGLPRGPRPRNYIKPLTV